MALIDDVQRICERLADHGWRDLLLRHGLDITAQNLANELDRELEIQRNRPGFEDFSPDGVRGIEPSRPGLSLLYHALASPAVHPTANGEPREDPDAYPTLEELDTVENYIYAKSSRPVSDLPAGAVLGVFSYQYRVGTRTPHGLYADLVFSRTGVARVGTAPANYDPIRRSFWVVPRGGGDRIAVMPARYGTFLAIASRPTPSTSVLEVRADDMNRNFLFPFHKIFLGEECLLDASISMRYLEFHRNEKLRRSHNPGGLPLLDGFRLDETPFVRDSRNAQDLVHLQQIGASILVVPHDNPTLVRTASQVNSQSGRSEIVRFPVPAATGSNRFWSSFQILAPDDSREAPEYLNIRHRVVSGAGEEQRIEDLNLLPEDPNPASDPFSMLLRDGGYEAAHFIDDTCDGCLLARVEINGASAGFRHRAAYSLVTAPDFFPLADQIAISRWAQRVLGNLQDHFSQGRPDPLSDGRLAANLTLPLPDDPARDAFDPNDRTMTAVVANLEIGPGTSPAQPAPSVPDRSVSYLPDNASNVFFPGWDVSRGKEGTLIFNAAYGLGSPFPEDAKLCAALNSFWPAVAPDASRTFNVFFAPTAKPLLDRELGYHPDHPRVGSGEVRSEIGWDGEQGPFFETIDGMLFANFANKDRSDYTANALAGLLRVSLTVNADANELIRRMEALRACIRVLPPNNDFVSTTGLFLVVAEDVENWGTRNDRGDQSLQGPGYLFVFAVLEDPEKEDPAGNVRRRRSRVQQTLTCQIVASSQKPEAICRRVGQGPFTLLHTP